MRAGQVLIVVLLVLAVALTTGLSIVSRSVNEVAQSTTSDESAKALAAAEAGIEASLGGTIGQGGEGTLVNNSSYKVISSNIADSEKPTINFPQPLLAGQTETLFLVGHDIDGNFDYAPSKRYNLNGNFDVCWGYNWGGSPHDVPALEITVYYDAGTSDYRVVRLGLDPDSSRGAGFIVPNTISASSSEFCPKVFNYAYYKRLNLSGDLGLGGTTPLFMRFKMLYNTSDPYLLGVASGNQADDKFPAQAVNVTVEGKTGSSTRTVQVANTYSAPYDIFDQAVYSGGSLGN